MLTISRHEPLTIADQALVGLLSCADGGANRSGWSAQYRQDARDNIRSRVLIDTTGELLPTQPLD